MLSYSVSAIFIISGIGYLIYTLKKAPSSFSIALVTIVAMISVGLITNDSAFSLPLRTLHVYSLSIALALASLCLSLVISYTNIRGLSWTSLGFPLLLFFADVPTDQTRISVFSYVQVFGLGTVFPLMVHVLNLLISYLGSPMSNGSKKINQMVALLLSLSILALMVIASNFVLGKESLFLLSAGIFISSVLFSSINLKGQMVLTAIVYMLLGLVLYSYFNEHYHDQIILSSYQVFSGFIFGVCALLLGALCSYWAGVTYNFFSKLLLFKAILGPVVFVLISGLLFFVFEAFGGRTSLTLSVFGAASILPLVNYIFENRVYGVMNLILGTSILLMPMLEHDKTASEITIESDILENNLPKLVYLGENGEEIKTELNDLSIAKGEWSIDEESSIVEFKVIGTESTTNGFFKGIRGKLEIGENFSETKMYVNIPVVGISTFNKTRDKSIRKDEIFFDEDKFPSMIYQVNSVSVENDTYTADGDFIMKGTKGKVKTNFIFVAKGTLDGKEIIILEGSGALDRTKFGQSSDASIGDEVSFTFKAVFKKV
jgi:polyisoprenoid-binding protein YceI